MTTSPLAAYRERVKAAAPTMIKTDFSPTRYVASVRTDEVDLHRVRLMVCEHSENEKEAADFLRMLGLI